MIIVDDREPATIIEALKQVSTVVKRRLSVGDYVLKGCIVERKTMADLWNSLEDNRIWNQLTRMASMNRKFYLLLEGQITTEAYGVLNAAALRWHCSLLFSKNDAHTVSILQKLALNTQPFIPAIFPLRTTHARPQIAIVSQF